MQLRNFIDANIRCCESTEFVSDVRDANIRCCESTEFVSDVKDANIRCCESTEFVSDVRDANIRCCESTEFVSDVRDANIRCCESTEFVSDVRDAASVMKKRKTSPNVMCLIVSKTTYNCNTHALIFTLHLFLGQSGESVHCCIIRVVMYAKAFKRK